MKNIVIILIFALISGCAHVPYTKQDKVAAWNFVIANAMDGGLTYYAIEELDAEEQNPLYGGGDLESILTVKLTTMATAFIAAEIWPEDRKNILWTAASINYGVSGWNTIQIID